jgi:hypothetical protein
MREVTMREYNFEIRLYPLQRSGRFWAPEPRHLGWCIGGGTLDNLGLGEADRVAKLVNRLAVEHRHEAPARLRVIWSRAPRGRYAARFYMTAQRIAA